MDIRKAELLKCSAGITKDCGICESCILQRKLSSAGEWMTRISEAKKQTYIRSLVQKCNSIEMISSLLRLLQPLQHKDFIYAKSKANATFDKDLVNLTNLSNKALNSGAVESFMLEDRTWFSSATSWAKFNYLLNILKSCNSFTLDNITAFLTKQYESYGKHILSKSHHELDQQNTSTNVELITYVDEGIFQILSIPSEMKKK